MVQAINSFTGKVAIIIAFDVARTNIFLILQERDVDIKGLSAAQKKYFLPGQ